MTASLEFHPFANLFPLIDGEAFDELVADIMANGLREHIVVHDGKLLDGRNRYRACLAAGLFESTEDPRSGFYFRNLADGVDPLAWVVSKNLKRRHLTDDQRRMVAARIANLGRGGDHKSNATNGGIARAKAAEMLAVDEKGVERARTVVTRGAEELQQAVDQRKVSVRMAADLAALPKEEQREIVALADPSAIRAAAKKIRAEDQAKKKERRIEREAELGARQVALPERRYGVIYADPEWRFEPWSIETGMDRAADNHYPTSELADIKSRNVRDIAAGDCVLFLWATAPMLPAALEVIAAWGFSYRTHMIWVKERAGEARGTGYWFTGEHELLLVAVKGQVPAPAPGTQARSVISAPVAAHSEKPEVFAKMIEEYFPSLPKIELNARRARPGWDAWGNEAPRGPTIGQSPKLPPAPGPTVPVEFSVGGMRKGSHARFRVRLDSDGSFAASGEYRFAGLLVAQRSFGVRLPTFAEALAESLAGLRLAFEHVRDSNDEVASDHHRAAARAGLAWIDARAAEWGLRLMAEAAE